MLQLHNLHSSSLLEPSAVDDLLGLGLLKFVPTFPIAAKDDIIVRHNLVQVSGCLNTLGWSREALVKHKHVKKYLRTINSYLVLNGNILRYGLLTL